MQPVSQFDTILVMICAVVVTAMLAVSALNLRTHFRTKAQPAFHAGRSQTAYLFEDNHLVDASEDAAVGIDDMPGNIDDWSKMIASLSPSFPDLKTKIKDLDKEGAIKLFTEDEAYCLEAIKFDNMRRVTVTGETRHVGTALDEIHQVTRYDELDTLRNLSNNMRTMCWAENEDGEVIWANTAYIKNIEARLEKYETMDWPMNNLFKPEALPELGSTTRVSLDVPMLLEADWFEIRCSKARGRMVYFAEPIDRLMRAETALSEFVQSLSRTFAHLSTGLAVFNKERRLTVFNPALTDISGLDPVFLSGRPTLQTFLDQMREGQRVPEPKNYKAWRDQISDLETGASDGTFQDTWTLASGETLRVTGRPHPGGAIVLLFDDISAQIQSTRQQRAERDIKQDVLNKIENGVVAFDHTGEQIFGNSSYTQLWGVEACEAKTIFSATQMWADKTRPSPVWGDIREYVTTDVERAEWDAEVRLKSGRPVQLKLVPIARRSTAIFFGASAINLTKDTAPPQDLAV